MAAMQRAACVLLLFFVLLIASACGGGSSTANSPTNASGNVPASAAICPPAWKPGWQQLANRIHAPVYCPSWMPAPLTGEIGGPWNTMRSVRKDGSYLMGFLWYETNVAETHVNFRAYPGQTAVPSCNGQPCFNDPIVKKQIGRFICQPYTVNRGADTWHLLYAWQANGTLYTVSQHIVPGLGITYAKVTANLDKMVRGLVRIDPQQS
jgi:hypothetical protein